MIPRVNLDASYRRCTWKRNGRRGEIREQAQKCPPSWAILKKESLPISKKRERLPQTWLCFKATRPSSCQSAVSRELRECVVFNYRHMRNKASPSPGSCVLGYGAFHCCCCAREGLCFLQDNNRTMNQSEREKAVTLDKISLFYFFYLKK